MLNVVLGFPQRAYMMKKIHSSDRMSQKGITQVVIQPF